AYSRGDTSALRVQTGLRRLLEGESDSFGLVYHCSENSFRMRALPLGMPLPGFIVAHEDITDLLKARRERRRIARDLRQVRDGHAAQIGRASCREREESSVREVLSYQKNEYTAR